MHPFNSYPDLNSYMKRLAINANGNTIASLFIYIHFPMDMYIPF